MVPEHRARSARDARRGYTLVEAVIAVAILGGALAAALHTLGTSATTRARLDERMRGQLLGEQLMQEILSQPYEGAGETKSGATRADFDCVGDYDGWFASPPEDRSGVPLAGTTDWTRSVEVIWVHPSDLTTPVGLESGVRRITVVAARGERVIAELVAWRTSAWDEINEP